MNRAVFNRTLNINIDHRLYIPVRVCIIYGINRALLKGALYIDRARALFKRITLLININRAVLRGCNFIDKAVFKRALFKTALECY